MSFFCNFWKNVILFWAASYVICHISDKISWKIFPYFFLNDQTYHISLNSLPLASETMFTSCFFFFFFSFPFTYFFQTVDDGVSGSPKKFSVAECTKWMRKRNISIDHLSKNITPTWIVSVSLQNVLVGF